MKKTIGELIKEIRKENKLTQKEFGDKFFLSPKTISNYENMDRMPDLEFITKVCDEFNLSLDYFTNSEKGKSNPNDLMQSSKNGKLALYDKGNSVCLTRFAYDKIIISFYNYHILLKHSTNSVQKFLYTKDTIKGIKYSALIDNYGRIKEFKDLVFGLTNSSQDAFNFFDTTFAYYKKDAKVHIVNANGEVLSEGYDRILPIYSSLYNAGPYIAFNFADKNYKEVSDIALLNYDGRKINFEARIDDDVVKEFSSCKVKAFSDVDTLVNAITVFGPFVTPLMLENALKTPDDIAKVFIAITKWIDGNEKLLNTEQFKEIVSSIYTLYFRAIVSQNGTKNCGVFAKDYGENILNDVIINNSELKKIALNQIELL